MKSPLVLISISSLAILTFGIASCQVVQPSAQSVISNTYSATWDTLNANDKHLLDKIEKAAFEFFWNGVNPNTGLGDASYTVPNRVSIATEGFALSAICIADTRGWITHREAYQRVLLILNSFTETRRKPTTSMCKVRRIVLSFHQQRDGAALRKQ